MRLISGRQQLQTAQSYFRQLQLYQGGLILLSAFVYWQHCVRAGGQGWSKVRLPLVVCISLSICLPTYSSAYTSIYSPPIQLSIHPSTHPLIHPSVHLSIYPSIHHSVVIIHLLFPSVFTIYLPLARHHSGTPRSKAILWLIV